MKKLLVFALVVVMMFSFAASGMAAEKEYNISVILKTTASEYWGYVVAGAQAYGKDHPNVHVQVKGATSETAYDEQQNMIETDMNNADIDGYVIAPLQADMVANMISGQKKPIVAVDTNIEAPEVLSFVGTGNESAGALGGAAAAKLAKERGWKDIFCIEIAGVQGDSTNEARMAGYAKGVESEGGKFLFNEIQYANAEANQAVACMEAIMQNHPEGIAIICANNDDMAMAAARAAAGNAAYKNTVFLGFDGIQSACNSILAGEETMSVCQEGYSMGYNSVDAVVRALNGEKLEKFIDAGASVVGPDTAQARLEQLQGYLK
ncbi:MAG: sugar ABC transporter substrate-binding protein [Synergistaceae bacterium]|nr:sugar ABC transporter substrate-binding protein [Synergistaceae bacterium]MBQ6739124.1 sugar ABC transporter substrate-binding protein [Synergistaceae bacterium]MBR0078980.1 sugar ABC transporter substrate-binding protein [Synergistaceae bacterium]MBR0253426.1 sugar ABC transporter substrate-binding protein [Synergistaceae bacterium]MBR0317055.1 sugar ABC transporter substrate-binding protein [Synergistaceae bacterium]